VINQIFNNFVRIVAIDQSKASLMVNEHILKMSKMPLTKEEFISLYREKKNLNVIEGTPAPNLE
jgi:hypothetical protein